MSPAETPPDGWAVSCQYAKANPFVEVQAIGRTKRGKPELRIDEARKLVTVAMEHATALDVGSTAALRQIFLGLRPTESVDARTCKHHRLGFPGAFPVGVF